MEEFTHVPAPSGWIKRREVLGYELGSQSREMGVATSWDRQ